MLFKYFIAVLRVKIFRSYIFSLSTAAIPLIFGAKSEITRSNLSFNSRISVIESMFSMLTLKNLTPSIFGISKISIAYTFEFFIFDLISCDQPPGADPISRTFLMPVVDFVFCNISSSLYIALDL